LSYYLLVLLFSKPATSNVFQMEAMVYLIIGITIAFLLTATLLFAICQCVAKPKSSNMNQHTEMLNQSEEADYSDRRSNSHHSRHSFLQQSPMTEETISLDDFENHQHRLSIHRRSAPKLIYTQEFSDGLMVMPTDNRRLSNGIIEADDVPVHDHHQDDSLAPLASFEEDNEANGFVPHQQYVLRSRGGLHHYHQGGGREQHYYHTHGHHHGRQKRPRSEMMMASSPMSEIHPRVARNGLPPRRPNSVLEDPFGIPPLSPPPDFHNGYSSDVPISMTMPPSMMTNHRQRPRRPETPLILSSFMPVPSISQPTPEEIQRDVDIVFHSMGLDAPRPPPPSTADST
jgi:hypothetical protein